MGSKFFLTKTFSQENGCDDFLNLYYVYVACQTAINGDRRLMLVKISTEQGKIMLLFTETLI